MRRSYILARYKRLGWTFTHMISGLSKMTEDLLHLVRKGLGWEMVRWQISQFTYFQQ